MVAQAKDLGQNSHLTPEEAQALLEWACSKLLAMRLSSPKPKEPQGFWPEYVTTSSTGDSALRAGLPNKYEITLMDKILLLPNVVPDPVVRRIIHSRSLVSPVGNKHLYSFVTIAKTIHSDARTVSCLYKKGLETIAKKTPQAQACAIRNSFASLTK